MIKFNKSATNNVVVTLKENSTISNPIYLFKFVSQQTLVSYYFIATDISAYKDRFNQFTVIEKANANTLNGEVSLGSQGYYDYKVYQTNLSNTTGLANAAAAVVNITKEVEDGLVFVVFAANTDITHNSIDNTTIVYQAS
jgi:hypothetical protein